MTRYDAVCRWVHCGLFVFSLSSIRIHVCLCTLHSAQETRNPSTDLPRGILGSLGICTVLYIATSLVLCGMAPYQQLNVAQPLSYAMELHGVSWLTPLISVGALCGLSSVMLVSLLGQTRIFYSMSVDGLLPAVFQVIHPKFNTPLAGTLVTGVFSALLAGLIPLEVTVNGVSCFPVHLFICRIIVAYLT
jgi:APA family basic amino acid/polyamine antiporter